jgi:uncharacterized repeat protein (TIGR03837 family)
MLWDIFCRIIDNHGDIGVSWRLSRDLASRGHRVRLWVDDKSALSWMAPHGCSGVEILDWTTPLDARGVEPGNVLLEAFGCQAAPELIATYAEKSRAKGIKNVWVNLEYLSAEGYVARSHGLPSPVMNGPGKGLTRFFFYPGFTHGTGGLLREPDLPSRQINFNRSDWLSLRGLPDNPGRLVSLFCYEPSSLPQLFRQLASSFEPTLLLVTAGRAECVVRKFIETENSFNPLWNINSSLSISYLPYLSQPEFDELLMACDLNFVRGEDSLVRAIWAGKPWVWQIYPQDDGVHHEKLEALLEALNAPESLCGFHRCWNASADCRLEEIDLVSWKEWSEATRRRLAAQSDLTSQLLAFVDLIANSSTE